MKHLTRLLSKSDVAKALESVDIFGIVENVVRAHGEGRVVMPAKISLNLGEDGSWPDYNANINAMPAYLGNEDIAGIKWAGGWWSNASKGLPSIMSEIILADPHVGLPLAIMEGEYITSMRTGAAAALGFKHLYKGGPARLAVIGAGVQGRTSLRMTLPVCPLREVAVYDLNPEAAQRYVQWAHSLAGAEALSVTAAGSVEEAVRGAELVLTCTPAKKPLVEWSWLQSARVICTLGSYQEITDEVGRKVDRRIVDSLAQSTHRGNIAAMIESGTLSVADIHAEIGDVLAGKAPGRVSEGQRILYAPIGMGSEDVGVAHAALREATRMNLGVMFDMESTLSLL